jgi:hypothetical protein
MKYVFRGICENPSVPGNLVELQRVMESIPYAFPIGGSSLYLRGSGTGCEVH